MFNTQRAMKNFVEVVAASENGRLSIAAAAAVAILVATNREENTPAEMEAKLRESVAESTGLGRSSVYGYIADGRKLAAKLLADFPDNEDGVPQGIVFDVFEERTPVHATTAIVKHLYKENVTSVDQLRVWLGGKPRSEQRLARAAKSADEGEHPPHTTPERAINTIVDASPAAVLERMRQIAEQITDRELIGDIIGIWENRLFALKPRRPSSKKVQHAGRSNNVEANILQ